MTFFARAKNDLSGTWQIAFDPDDVGTKAGWPKGNWPDQQTLPIHVPGIWNKEYPDADGVGFYRRSFTIPDLWQGKAILLHFVGATYRCDAWINGRFSGSHEGGYTPFSFDITSNIHYGQENELIIRVAALSKKKLVDGMQLKHAPLSKQTWHYVYGGLWGQVYLEACPLLSINTLHIDPRLSQERAQIEIILNNRNDLHNQASLRLKLWDQQDRLVLQQEHSISALPGITTFLFTLEIPHPLAWSMDHPHLYRLETSLIDEDGQTDEVVEQFGMREFTVHNGAFYLNGQPVYIRGVLLQPNFPINLVDYPDPEMMLREITLVKQAGFNLIRLHILPAVPGFLDLADRLGILIYAETCLAWIRDNPRMLDHGRRETQALIERDRNHPSVVFWGIYNENPPACATNGEALVRHARSIDLTRVVINNSGGSLAIDQDFGWIDRAVALPAYSDQPEPIMDIHLYLGAPLSNTIYDWLQNLGKGSPSRAIVEERMGLTKVLDEFDRELRTYSGKIFISELGYGGMSDLEDTVAGFRGREDLLDAREFKTLRDSMNEGFQKRKLECVLGTPHNLYLEAQKFQSLGNNQQLQALLANPRISGFIITQLNDVSWEFHAGLLDLWRNPKLSYYAAQKLNQPNIIVLRPRKMTAKPGDQVEIEVCLVNDTTSTMQAQLSLIACDPINHETVLHQEQFVLRTGIISLANSRLLVEAPGMYRIIARLEADSQILYEATESIFCLEAVDWGKLTAEIQPVGQKPSLVSFHANQNENSYSDGPILLAAYPSTIDEAGWESLLSAVEQGQTAIIGALRPEDRAAIAAFSRHGIQIKLHFGMGSWMGCYHWIPESTVFSGLPAGGLAMSPYTDIIPKYILTELGGEVLAGSLRNTQTLNEELAMAWFSDIEVTQLGKGKLLFCQYRVFDAFDRDPLADRLAWNLFHNCVP